MPPTVPTDVSSFKAVSQPWKPGSDRALVVIHGVGDYKKADYTKLLASLETAVTKPEWDQYAVYLVLYDLLNDWTTEKQQAANLANQLIARLKVNFETSTLGETAAEGVGDVLWPVLELDARLAIRDAIIRQLIEVTRDGFRAGVPFRDQKISIVAHSLGCFHTYEALSAMAADPQYRMQPVPDAVQFHSVVMMASPVQLIRSVSGWLGRLIPDPDNLYCLRNSRLELPGVTTVLGRFVPSARRLISLTGTMDPVGGHLMGDKLDWAYMNIVGQESRIDDQGTFSRKALTDSLKAAMATRKGLPLAVGNPHDWVGYVDRNAKDVKEWLVS